MNLRLQVVTDNLDVISFIRTMNEEYRFGFTIEALPGKLYLEKNLNAEDRTTMLIADLDDFPETAICDILRKRPGSTVVVKKQYTENELRNYFKCGAVDCITTPLNKSTIYDLMHELKKKISEQNPQPKRKLHEEHIIKQSLKISLAYDLIYGNLKSSKEIWDRSNYIGLAEVPNTVMIVQIDDFFALTKNKSTSWEHALRQGVFCSVHGFFASKKEDILLFSTATDKIAVLLSVPLQNSHREYKELAKSYAAELKEYIRQNTGQTVTICLGNYYEDARNLHISYREALYAQKYKFFVGKDTIIHIDDVEPFSHEVAMLPYDDVLSLASKLSIGDFAGVKQSVENLLRNLCSQKNINPEAFKIQILELLTTLARSAIKGGAKARDIFSLHLKYAIDLNTIENVMQMKRWIGEVVDHFLEQVLTKHNEQTLKSVQKAVQYIEKRYNQDISLEEVANHVHLSPNYFCSIFKSTTGRSFVEYITNLRIEKAKEMLMDLDYTIYHIADAVGYNDPRYFSRVFKTITGKTPSQYRNSILVPKAVFQNEMLENQGAY